jgi:hypothetical protein
LKLIRKLAEPIANDVRRHQMALQAFAMYQLAMPATEKSRETLILAKQLAETSINGVDEPPSLGHWALGLVALELGRLETSPDPWNEERHHRASPWFERARQNLESAKQGIVVNSHNASWIAEINDQLSQLNSSEFELQQARKLLAEGRPNEAAPLILRCATLHREPSVAELLADCRRLKGDPLEELDEFVSHLWKSELFSDLQAPARLIRGRQGVLRIWHQLSNPTPDVNQRPESARRIVEAMADLQLASETGDKSVRIIAELYLALGSVIQLSTEPDRHTETAKLRMQQLPLLIAELQQRQKDGLILESWNTAEATIAGWLAYGSLGIRFLSDYRDVSQKALTTAIDARSAAPSGLKMPEAVGGIILQSLLSRPDRADARLAAEEHFVRQALEQTFPAIAAIQLAPSSTLAARLQSTARQLESSDSIESSRIQFAPLVTLDARTAASRNVSNATILAFLAANEPAEAIHEVMISLHLSTANSDLESIDVSEIQIQSLKRADPIRQSIVAMAF